MPNEKFGWLIRIKAVEREYATLRIAADRLTEDVRRDPTILEGNLTLRDALQASERLQGTYVIRLFAEFETGLRLFWPTARMTDPPSRTRDLLDGVAATRAIENAVLERAHAVRDYRNSLIHIRGRQTQAIPISRARGYLCQFFQFLPLSW
jgi:hypothetical protein